PGTRTTLPRIPPTAAIETESGRQKHSRFQIRRFRTRRVRATPIDQSANRGVGLRLWRGGRVLKQCERDPMGKAIPLRSRIVARGNIRGDRFAGTESVPPAKWPSSSRVADLQRTLPPPH